MASALNTIESILRKKRADAVSIVDQRYEQHLKFFDTVKNAERKSKAGSATSVFKTPAARSGADGGAFTTSAYYTPLITPGRRGRTGKAAGERGMQNRTSLRLHRQSMSSTANPTRRSARLSIHTGTKGADSTRATATATAAAADDEPKVVVKDTIFGKMVSNKDAKPPAAAAASPAASRRAPSLRRSARLSMRQSLASGRSSRKSFAAAVDDEANGDVLSRIGSTRSSPASNKKRRLTRSESRRLRRSTMLVRSPITVSPELADEAAAASPAATEDEEMDITDEIMTHEMTTTEKMEREVLPSDAEVDDEEAAAEAPAPKRARTSAEGNDEKAEEAAAVADAEKEEKQKTPAQKQAKKKKRGLFTASYSVFDNTKKDENPWKAAAQTAAKATLPKTSSKPLVEQLKERLRAQGLSITQTPGVGLTMAAVGRAPATAGAAAKRGGQAGANSVVRPGDSVIASLLAATQKTREDHAARQAAMKREQELLRLEREAAEKGADADDEEDDEDDEADEAERTAVLQAEVDDMEMTAEFDAPVAVETAPVPTPSAADVGLSREAAALLDDDDDDDSMPLDEHTMVVAGSGAKPPSSAQIGAIAGMLAVTGTPRLAAAGAYAGSVAKSAHKYGAVLSASNTPFIAPASGAKPATAAAGAHSTFKTPGAPARAAVNTPYTAGTKRARSPEAAVDNSMPPPQNYVRSPPSVKLPQGTPVAAATAGAPTTTAPTATPTATTTTAAATKANPSSGGSTPGGQSYVISDYCSSDSEMDSDARADSKPGKKVPEWASRKALTRALEQMRGQDPDEIFSVIMAPDLTKIFGNKSRYHKRHSSANWSKDALTRAENDKYKLAIGISAGHQASRLGTNTYSTSSSNNENRAPAQH